MFKNINKDKVRKILYIVTAILVVLHPIIELDYLAYPFLKRIGLPRLTTIVNLIILPLMVLLTFFFFENDKKKLLKFVIPYGIVFCIYFVLHCQNANYLQNNMYLTNNFVFLISDEIIYTLALLLPLAYIWVFNKQDIRETTLKYIITTTSVVISLPIFIANLFVFGFSTYEGNTIDNIFSWFSLPFNDGIYHPRYYASKFFFDEGNTIGIILFVILPLLYYFLYKENNKKNKLLYTGLIFVQSIAMIMLSTRVATMGSFLIPLAMLAVYLFLIIIKTEKFKSYFLCINVFMMLVTGMIYPYSPAYQNQQINAKNYEFQKEVDPQRAEADAIVREGAEGLIKYSEEWFGFYTFMFEAYSYMVRVTPPVYYREWYSYKHDPEFWVNLIFDYELEERINGRQLQTIFLHYKYDPLTTYQKAMGIGYGTFMRGSMILERDFEQQYYSYGPVGFALIMMPWLLVTAFLGIKLLLGYKKGRWTYLNITLMMCLCLGLVSSYVSGHTLDELSSSLFIALCAGALFRNLRSKHVED